MAVAPPDYWKLAGKPPLFSISEIFHENSKIRKGASHFVISAEAAHAMSEGFKSYHFTPACKLPTPLDLESTSLKSCVLARKSIREYSGRPLARLALSTLLAYSCRVLPDTRRRPAPSAGALFPLEVYCICLNTEDVEKGIYHYDVRNHTLQSLCRPESADAIRQSIFVPEIAHSAAVIFVVTAVFGRTKIKYGERGYRFALLEAGHLAQNLTLVGTAIQVGTCAIGGFIDDVANDVIDVDGVEEASIYLISAGNIDS